MSPLLPGLVYLLCFLTAALCAGLLTRQYRLSGTPVLMWSAVCFGLLALSNLLVVLDRMVLADIDLRTLRLVLTLVGVSVLLFGFIWESESE